MANLTGKTIGQLALLTGITQDTLFAVELSGATYQIPYSGLSTGGGTYEEVTYTELFDMYTGATLTPGGYYLITDYRTCYDRPDYDKYRNPIAVSNDSYVSGSVEPILVLATSINTLALNAYQPQYPKDSIKYDITYNLTESGNPAFGRITERIDEFGNRTDYDHRTITFKRYLLRTYNRLNPLPGTVQLQSDGTVLGTLTSFNSLFIGQIIAIINTSETFYEIVSITDDTTMIVSGETITDTGGGGFRYFNTNSGSYDSYYPNNINGQLDFTLYNTFDAIDGCLSTYIGDHSKYFINEGIGDFLLANNVFKDGRYDNNTIGDSSYNNTFNDDCTSNQIGFAFRNNITDDDFDGNVIGSFFENNIITANFQYNQIGYSFEFNNILNNSFYRNRIGNNFNTNWIDGDFGFDFQNNQIGNQFENNVVYRAFYKNVILNGYNQNNIWGEFVGNKVGNGFNGNNIYNQFNDNLINDYFDNNIIGDSLNIGSGNFYDNIIGNSASSNTITGTSYGNQISNDFNSNTIGTDFIYNVIGSNFSSNVILNQFGYNHIGYGFYLNTIADGFGYGGGQPRGNKIGSNFYSNNVGEYFYDNIICEQFNNNIILVDFRFNEILYPVNSTDFSTATHVYGDYNCKVVKSNDNNIYLEYLNVTTPTYVSITA